MANSRKSLSLNNIGETDRQFERALGEILARVSISAPERIQSIGVAYSGGLDSSVLLHLAARFAARHAVQVHAFHIHHGLSPNADAWTAHCERVADQYKVRFAAARVEVADIDRHGTEQAARMARYEALNQLCRAHDVTLLLTAHHLDDQAETVFLQLLRGAGLPGLSGMASLQEDHALLGKGLYLGRPLLNISRSALEKLASGQGLDFVTDESNTDPAYRRNALRHDIFPAIERYFPSFAIPVARSASHAQSAQSLLDELAMIDLATCKADKDSRALNLNALNKLSIERIDNLLRYWLHQSGFQLPSTARLEEIREQMLHAEKDRHPISRFGPVILSRIGDRLEIRPDLGVPPSEEIVLQWEGQLELPVPQWQGSLFFEHAEQGLDPSLLQSLPLVIQARNGHEKLKIAQNRPSKSLKNLFQEAFIPPWQREWLPVFYLDDKLLFVAGLGMDSRHCIVPNGIKLRWESHWQKGLWKS